MKLKNILFCLFVFVFMYVQISAQTNPVVSNVAFSISGTTVTVIYDVSDAEQATVTIIMQVSSDGGTTWDYNYGTANGDIGPNIITGNGKAITWTYAGAYNNNFIMKIIANDETAGGDACGKVYYAGGPNDDNGPYYNTIQIANQCWLKENLDVGTRINSFDEATNNTTIEKYCYGDNLATCTIYGGLYQWAEAMQYSTTPAVQGICPPGWHLPTLAELQTLKDAVGGSGNALKREDQGSGSGQGTNTSGFSALLAGNRLLNGGFNYLGTYAYVWSSTAYSEMGAKYLNLQNSNSNIPLSSTYKLYGFSVRCLKD